MDTKKNIILFDGECTFCAFWVKFILKRDKRNLFLFTSLQSDKGIALRKTHRISDKVDSVVLIIENRAFIKSNAVIKILFLLGGLRKAFIVLKIFPRFIRDFVYDIVAWSRYKLFKRKTCELPSDPNFKNKFL